MKPILAVIAVCVFSFQLHAQVSFVLSSSPVVGSAPQCVTAADVNGDGKVDLISASQDKSTLSVLTNDGSGHFVLASSPAVGNQPFSAVAADVNGDSKVDLISANWGGNTLTALTNNGGGGFVLASTLNVGSGPFAVVAADVNRDVKVDLICANIYDNTLMVLTNNGSGGFVTSGTYAVGSFPWGLTEADVNGDGTVDLICANFQGNDLSVLTNDGSGHFVLASSPDVGYQPVSVVTVDVNGDGKVDLISASQGDSTLSVVTNDGIGGFVTFGTYTLGSLPETATAADVNGDGKVDLIWGSLNANTLTVMTNNGVGGFATAGTWSVGNQAQWVTAADVNGDGKLDLICANYRTSNLSVLTNATPFPPSALPVITGFSPMAATNGASVMLSGNNFSSAASNNIVYFGAVRAAVTAASVTNLTVTVPVGATYGPITETVNGLTAYSDLPFLPTFPGMGQINSSSLAPAVNLGSGNGPSLTIIGDLDRDGKPDLVEINAYDGSLWVYQNISTSSTLTTASFAPPVVFTFGGNVRDSLLGLGLADLVGDGHLDIVVANTFSNVISIFQTVSSPGNLLTTNSFASRVDIPMAGGPISIAMGDLDGDGRPDIVVANEHNNTVSVLRNISTGGMITAGSFAPAVSFATPSSPRWLTIADMDGDGKPDLVMANGGDTSHGLSVFRNSSSSGNIAFDLRVDFAGLPQFLSLAIGDLDGDGKPDVAVTSFQFGQSVSLYRNTSTPGSITSNSFGPRVDFSVGGWGNTVAIGDLDGDGKPDLAVVTQLPDHLSIFKNISAPGSLTASSFAARVDFPAGYNPNGTAIGDLSGDGRPDIVFGNSYDNTLSIYQNIIPTSTPPTITGEPQDAYVDAYGTASFTVTTTGASSYHWWFNSSNLLNATSSTLTIPNVQQTDLGPYSVIVANSYGAVTSSIANLYMYPAIVTPFTGLVTDWGQSNTLSVGAWGSGALTFQWYDNGVIIPNATNSTLTFSSIQFTNAGLYSVVITSSLGSVTNTPAQVVVNSAGVSLGLYPGITVTGVVGYTYDIQSNPDLTNTNGWTTVATLTLFQPVVFWVDVNHNAASPTNQHRFYRVLPGQ